MIVRRRSKVVIHPEARTTPQIRAEIKASVGISQQALAEKYNVSRHTIKKWQTCDKSTDKSHRPDHLQTRLTPIQEEIVAIPLDDLLVCHKRVYQYRGYSKWLAPHTGAL
jgi:hypothetical protein